MLPANLWSLTMVLWPVVIVRLRKGTQGGHWSDLVCLWVEWTGTGEPNLDKSFLAGISCLGIGYGGTVGDKVCVAPEVSVGQCIG